LVAQNVYNCHSVWLSLNVPSVTMGKHGHCATGVAGGLMLLAMIASSISIGSTWWSNNEGKVTFSLWTFKMETEFAEFEADHDDVCETPGGGETLAAYCLKIRAARATTIMTAISALFTAAFHIRGYCKDSSWLGWTGIATNTLAVGSAGFAIRMGLVLKADSTLNENPGAGFIFIAVACGLAAASFMLAVTGKVASCKGSAQYGGGGGDYKGYGGRPPVGGISAPSSGGQRQPHPPAMMPLPPAPVMTMTAGVAPPPGFGGSSGYSAPQSGGSGQGDFGIQPMGMPPLSGGASPQAYGNPQGYGGSPGGGQPGISFGGQRQVNPVAPSMPALPPQYQMPRE